MQLGLDKVAPYSSYDELERRLLCEDILHLVGMGAKNMGWYGHAKPAGTALQRHLFTTVKQLKQYSVVYIKQPGEATPSDCTPQKLLFTAHFCSAVTADTRSRVCIVPLSTLQVQPYDFQWIHC
jgi:hypothetical protein